MVSINFRRIALAQGLLRERPAPAADREETPEARRPETRQEAEAERAAQG